MNTLEPLGFYTPPLDKNRGQEIIIFMAQMLSHKSVYLLCSSKCLPAV